MSMRSLLLAVIATAFISGCGGPPPPPMDHDAYEKLMMAQFEMQTKGKSTKADLEKLYAKFNVKTEQVFEAQKLWGEPDAVQKKRFAMIEKMTNGSK